MTRPHPYNVRRRRARFITTATFFLVAAILLAPFHPDHLLVAPVIAAIPAQSPAARQIASQVMRAVGNIVLFVPIGWLATRQMGRRSSGLLAGALLSAAGQLGQIFILSRVPSLTGLLLNILGALIGAQLANPRLTPHRAGRRVGNDVTRPDMSRGRAARVRRPLARAGVVTFVLAVAALLALLDAVPGVTDAEARARHVITAHGSPDLHLDAPPKVAAALVATEDSGFYSNPGVDPAGVARWLTAGLTGAAGDAGGATLEQQLARTLYSHGQRSPAEQVKQVGLAIELAHTWPKSEILEMYLATAYFGHGYYGLNQAARGYFAVSPARLDWNQAALVVGLVQAPTAYDPRIHPTLAKSRRSHVLNRLAATGYLTQAEATIYEHGQLELGP